MYFIFLNLLQTNRHKGLWIGRQSLGHDQGFEPKECFLIHDIPHVRNLHFLAKLFNVIHTEWVALTSITSNVFIFTRTSNFRAMGSIDRLTSPKMAAASCKCPRRRVPASHEYRKQLQVSSMYRAENVCSRSAGRPPRVRSKGFLYGDTPPLAPASVQ